jgi:hypothetical protein
VSGSPVTLGLLEIQISASVRNLMARVASGRYVSCPPLDGLVS